jgi:hypothetical protein
MSGDLETETWTVTQTPATERVGQHVMTAPNSTVPDLDSTIWQYSRMGGSVVFDFRLGRDPRRFLGEFNGILQSDGYEEVLQTIQTYQNRSRIGKTIKLQCIFGRRLALTIAMITEPRKTAPNAR